MNNLNDVKFKCCGCNACVQICPKKAISFVENEEGFREFYIDESKCIKCGLCVKKCPQINGICTTKEQQFVPKYYAAYMRDQNEIKKSASGGIFQIIAKKISKSGDYSIFGCKYDNNFQAVHDYIDDINDLNGFLSSKYVQSNVEGVYEVVKNKLDRGRTVLFSGTPCQVAGLYSYLGSKNYDRLFTVDIVCHGVSSPLLFKKYVEHIENKHNNKLIDFNFRSKIKNTWDEIYYYKVGNRQYSGNYYFNTYYYNFIKGNICRECCYDCIYARKTRISDITIGDYWGIEKVHPDIFNQLGVSLMVINTKKGDKLFELIKNDIVYCESTFENMSKYNHNLISPTVRPNKRNNIYAGIKEKSYEELAKKNLKYKISIRTWLSLKTPKRIKKILKKQ